VACVLAAIGLMGALGFATALCGAVAELSVLEASRDARTDTGEAAAAVRPAP
jgi:hypothetical protein